MILVNVYASSLQLTRALKGILIRRQYMTHRASLVVLAVLLLATAPLIGPTSEITNVSEDELLVEEINRIEVLPDPDSVRDLGTPTVIDGLERTREETASSTIGMWTEMGLIPSVHISSKLSIERPDLAMVIIDGDVGIWDARVIVEDYSNVEIRSTIPPSGFLVQGQKEQIQMLDDLDEVIAIHSVPSGIIVHPLLRVVEEGPIMIEILGWKNDDLFRQNNPGLNLDTSLDEVADMWMKDNWSPEEGRFWGEIDLSNIDVIASHPAVSWISPLPALKFHNNNARNHIGINNVESFFITDLDGSGQTIAVGDSGIDHDHGDFDGRIVSRTSVTPGDSSTADLSDGHGTHVACTILGSGMRSSGIYQGVAPEASLYFQAMEDDDTGSLYSYGINTMLNSAYDDGARIHTNSWGSRSGYGSYSTQSEDADDRTSTWDQYWSHEGMTVLFAAGNERDDGVSPPGTAKNVITVGGHKNRYSGSPDEMYYWSSRGPTDDGRLKPDVVAPGDGIRSCLSQEAESASSNWDNNWYIEYSGTSMATPAAAGSAALIREYLMEVANRPAPQGALIKAMLILGAEDIAGGTDPIPNNDEGWGRINLVNSLIPDSDEGIFVDDRSRIKSGETREYTFDVTRAGEPLKVVLAWSDYPGSSTSSDQLRNDLNLEVVHPNGNIVYKGNVFNSGHSVTGGNFDSVNNVEVVLVESASTGIWSVRVKDDYHGGSNVWQSYAIAVRGVNVNDLSPDPSFQQDVSVEPTIPQIGENVQISISVQNLGSGSVSDLEVMARADGSLISTKLISISPGEIIDLMWNWTPNQEGLIELTFYIDPNNLVDENSESNNFLSYDLQISSPGVRVSSDDVMKVLGDATDSSTQWLINLQNTALFETNATIEASNPVRLNDGLELNWFKSFTSTTFNLQAAETVDIGFTLIHPAPPEPGNYEIVITGTDIDNSIQSVLNLYFEVPVLADAEVDMPGGQVYASPITKTHLQFYVTNDGNGPQTYDVELVSPSGWHLGLDAIGAFEGSSHGSTGTLAVGETRAVDVTINPPGAMIPAGTVFDAAVNVRSRVSNDVWNIDLPIVVDVIDQLSMTPMSDGTENEVPPDSTLELSIIFQNTGNRDLELNPIQRAIPGGWSLVGSLQTINVNADSTAEWSVTLQGNGRAVSGDFRLSFTTDDGFTVDWNRTLDVLSAAVPSIAFHQVAFSDGSTSGSPLGLGPHPVGQPFDLSWVVENEGTSPWRPETSILLPNEAWSGNCPSTPSTLAPSANVIIWCTITIPISEEAGTEPIVILSMVGEGITAEHSVSLQVDAFSAIEWNLISEPIAFEGYPAQLRVEIENIGNSQINHRLDLSSPSGWDSQIKDGYLLILSPGEKQSRNIEFTPSSGSDGTIVISLTNAADIEGSSYPLNIDVQPSTGDDNSLNFGLILVSILLLVVIIGGVGFYVFKYNPSKVDNILSSKSVTKFVENLNINQEEASSGIECWICSRDIFVGNALACGVCGARYHKVGQVSGCDIISIGKCLHCNAGSEELVDA